MRWLVVLGLGVAIGCGTESTTDDDGSSGTAGSGIVPPDTSIAVLGGGIHDLTGVLMTEAGTAIDGLNAPRDLAFNPSIPGELWVVNFGDDSVVVYANAGQPGQLAQKHPADVGGQHFLSQPSGIAFGLPAVMATIQDQDQPTQGNQTPADFMGPTLWSANAASFVAGDVSHLDMLHNSPLGMGITWERDYVYWVFDGFHSSVTRYDFVMPHVLGGVDHEDGVITRYVEGQVRRVPGVVSQMEFLRGTTKLYIADTGNARIGVLETSGATPSGSIGPNYDGCTMNRVDSAAVATLIDGNTQLALQGDLPILMPAPSGLAIHNVPVGGVPQDVLFVTDAAASVIYGFSLEGVLLDWLFTGLAPGSLAGVSIDAIGDLYIADPIAHRVLHFAPAPPTEG